MENFISTVISIIIWILKNILWINILLAILVVFFERRDPKSTWLWLMIFFFLPGIGFIFYLLAGQDLKKRNMFKLKEEEDKYIRDLVRNQERNIQRNQLNFDDPEIKEHQDLIQYHLAASESIYFQNNKVEVYFSGQDKFKALIDSLEKAEEFIHMEYYIIRNDNIGKKIMKILTDKAKAGVEVKLLYDGMGGRHLPKDFGKELVDGGGKIGVFFPSFGLFKLSINYRNHRKICVIDGKEAFIGGFNIGDEYLGLSKRFGFWRDTHLKIEGEAITGLEWRFLLDWRFASKEEFQFDRKYFPELEPKGKTSIQIVSSGPDSKWSSIKDGYFKMISNARQKVYIQTPYFIPDDSILESLKIAALSGIDVRIIIPSKPDHPFVYWASLSYMGELLKAGVRFYIYNNGFIHSKVVISDDVLSSVGSANLDIRSFELNFEVNAFMYDEEINKKITDKFIDDLNFCKEITMEEYEKRSFIIKFKESISRLLSPIL